MMPVLPGPYEILEMGDGGSLVTTVEKWAEGEMQIHPRDGRDPKTINVVRVHVPKETKPLFPDYYDLTSQTLTAQLRPLLPTVAGSGRKVRITKHGFGPKARFSVEVI